MNKKEESSAPAYTQKGYAEQLNYQLWSTSRIRFAAAKRLREKNQLSNQMIAYSSAYVILLSIIQIFIENDSLNSFLTVINVFFAIVILVVSQLESAADYSLRSNKFNECGLKVSRLYSELRRLKGEKKDGSGLDTLEFSKKIAAIDEQYGELLFRYENHEEIDYLMFKASYPNYEDHKLSPKEVTAIKRSYCWRVKGFALSLMYIPPILLLLLSVWQILLKPSQKDTIEYIFISCFSSFFGFA
ncbi:TPA: SLATT domain-containing protein [Vibrio vulnificus]|uniref:SLATT domain-containing protein n=1 Tax=Vibrio vulnificus TaxID=672 RepID=UPI001FAEA0A1|nr:SLATT domain-containing protein [Vibrio vulnificus]MCJ0806936.1 SLATT domain-containing protein [Vibrio vulnificus]HAU8285648.1 SLATT domain-containing protein [Vibrio vulnificus]HDY7531240.1 SLATT domain-containing protein [Vibrio vulnificus]